MKRHTIETVYAKWVTLRENGGKIYSINERGEFVDYAVVLRHGNDYVLLLSNLYSIDSEFEAECLWTMVITYLKDANPIIVPQLDISKDPKELWNILLENGIEIVGYWTFSLKEGLMYQFHKHFSISSDIRWEMKEWRWAEPRRQVA